MSDWWLVTGRSAVRDLWVSLTWPDKPTYGPWLLPDGRDIVDLVATGRLDQLGFRIWYEQMEGCRAPLRRNDVLHCGGLQVKVVSTRFVEALHGLGVTGLSTYEADVVLRSGESLSGYVGLVEPTDPAAEVHSYLPGGPSMPLCVSGRVLRGLRERGVDLFDVEPDPHGDRLRRGRDSP